jgi:hypothetical protein
MSSIQKRGASKRIGVAVVWAAVLLFALAPAVSALCALDIPGVRNSGADAVVQAPTALHDSTGRGDDPCCAAMSAPVIESSKPFGVSLAGSMQPDGPSVAAARATAVQAFAVARPLAHLSTPPPEPVSRRFPRLLI